MSFRLRIVMMTTALIVVLFSVGGAVLIHTSFEASLQKEEQAAVDSNELILRVVQYVGRDGSWMSEEELVAVIENICQQDTIDCLYLKQGEEIVYTYEKIPSISAYMNSMEGVAENQVQIGYFMTSASEHYMQTSTTFELNSHTYYLDTCRKLTDIFRVREEQIAVFQNIFLVLSLLGMVLSWLTATFITRHLRKLTKATKELASGNLAYRTNIFSCTSMPMETSSGRFLGRDEVGELSIAFDQMAEKLEENVRLLRESAEQKEMFMGAFTHELKTPMTSIIGYADLLRTQKLSQKEQTEALDYIFSEGKRLENLSIQMLDLFVADKKEVSMKECNPAQLVAYVTKHLRNTFLQSGIAIEVQAEQGLCMLEPDLFQTLLINLLDNAKKAMENGGTIVVEVKMTELGCTLRVMDEGKGIPEDALKHLTEAFYRVDKARARNKGSAGLGLALCEKIVELHHGSMHFESQEGVGTVVTVRLKGGLDEAI